MATSKTIFLIIGSVLALAFGIIQTWKAMSPRQENDHISNNFPHAFIARADAGHRDAVQIWHGRVPPATVEINGAECFPAWRCNNAHCPGRTGDNPYIFGHDSSKDPSAMCPLCAVAIQKAPEAQRGDFDPSNTTTYYTAEAEALVKSIQADQH